MPFRSEAQRRRFARLLVEGKISPQTFEEWNRETGEARAARTGAPDRDPHARSPETIAATADAEPLSQRYFSDALGAYARAAERTGELVHDCIVGAMPIRLRIAGDPMRRAIVTALHHLAPAPPEPPAAIEAVVFDSATSGVAMPAPEWPLDAYGDRGEIAAFATGGVRAAFTVEGPTVELFDRSSRRAIVWAADAARVPQSYRGAPMRWTLSWWLADRGLQLMHAAVMAVGERGALIVGRGGAGKSSLALACLREGLTYFSDDYAVVHPAEPSVYALYATAKLRAGDVSRFPFLTAARDPVAPASSEKRLFYLADRFGDRLGSRCVVAAVILPRVAAGGRTSLARATPAEATRAIVASTLPQLPYAAGEVLSSAAALLRRAPAFHMQLGDDALESAPAMVAALCAKTA